MDLPKRKQIRLPDYDYSAPSAYFVTACLLLFFTGWYNEKQKASSEKKLPSTI